MKQEHVELWQRIAAFAIDGEGDYALPFAVRLARENGWTRSYAERVIHEYKRYVFLCLTAGRPMCPSEQVDQAWHLHLTYTRSYWHRFCKEVLHQPLHHEPTRGGAAEADKHLTMYKDTFTAYREAFGVEPPRDCWPPAEQRFGDDLAERRVNVRQYWLIPKAPVKQVAVSLVMLVSCVTLFAGCNGGLNPFDAVGVAFLPYYLLAFSVAFVIACLVRRSHRGPGLAENEQIPDLGDYEKAYLAGGIPRVQALALLRLTEKEYLELSETGKVKFHYRHRPNDTVEKAVADELEKQDNSVLKMHPIGAALQNIEQTRFSRMQELGLRASLTQAMAGRVLPMLVMLVPLLLLGLPRLVMGLNNGKDVGFLIIAIVIGLIISAVAFLRPIRRTLKGDAVLAHYQQQHTADLRRLDSGSDVATIAPALAIFGTAALAGTSYAYMQQRMRPLDNSGAGSCSSTSGCSGGGCGGGGDGGGGGGCGGCGGGGGD